MALLSATLPPPDEAFPWSLPLLRHTRDLVFAPSVTVLVGENGSGKSTLLEAIALAAELPTAGSRDLSDDPTLDALRPFADALRLVWTERRRSGLFFRSEDYYGYVQRLAREQAELRARAAASDRAAAHLHDGERRRRAAPFLGPVAAADARYGGDLDARSHGESFLAFFRGRLRGPGLYLLDEPEAALSPVRQLAFLSLLREAVGRGAQFIVATHAPILMAYPGATLYELLEDGAAPARFDELSAVRTLKAFLDDPEAFLRRL
jgi:predicted ATPase